MRWRRAACVIPCLAVLLVSLAFGSTARAQYTPGADGEFAWCAIRVSNTTPGAAATAWIRCQGAGALTAASGIRIGVFGSTTVPPGGPGDQGAIGSANSTGVTVQSSGRTSNDRLEWTGAFTWNANFQAIFYNLNAVCTNGTHDATSGCTSATGNRRGVQNVDIYYGGGLAMSDNSCVGPGPYNGCAKTGRVVSATTGSGFPSFPAYGGAASGATGPEIKCSASLTASTLKAKFSAAVTDGETGTVAYDWDFGDGTTGSGSSPSHTYASADDGGDAWEVSVVGTRGGVQGNTCYLTFTLDEDGTVIGDDAPGDDGDPSESCSLLDVPCWLRKLFIPDTTALSDKWDDVQESADGNWPVGPVTWAAGVVGDAGDAVQTGHGVGHDVITHDTTETPDTVDGSGTGFTLSTQVGDETISAPLLRIASGDCDDEVVDDADCSNSMVQPWVYWASTIAIVLGLVYTLHSMAEGVTEK